MTNNINLNININISITREQAPRSHQWLVSIARRIESIEAEAQQIALSDSRILNRLHALGINAYAADVTAAREVNARNREAGLILRDAATIVGLEADALQALLNQPNGDDGMPPVSEVYRSDGGRVVTFDYFDLLLLRRWLEARKEA